MSVNDKMKAIADAIRAHTGGTDALTLDAMAQAITGLEVGGGAKFATGEFTAAENTSDCVVQHDLGVVPDLVAYWSSAGVTTSTNYAMVFAQNTRSGILPGSASGSAVVRMTSNYHYYPQGSSKVFLDSSNNSQSSGYSNGAPYNANESTVRLMQETDTSRFFLGGVTYRWIAIGGVL